VKTAVIVGNPKAQSRTLDAATIVAKGLTDAEPDVVVDCITLGAGLLGWGDPAVAAAKEQVMGCDVLVVASPTYKATYTGLLKLFLEQFGADELDGRLAYPVMLGAAPNHAMAPDLLLKPVLVEIGASCPARGLYLLDQGYADAPELTAWLDRARRTLA
jgi:FMN reductase